MKTLLWLIVFASVIIFNSCDEKKTVDIKDTRQLKDSLPDWNSEGKKDRDFVLYRPFDKVYGIILYRMKEGKLVSQGFLFADFYDYNKAKYRWVNDSTLTFTMFGKIHESDRLTMKISRDGSFKLERGN